MLDQAKTPTFRTLTFSESIKISISLSEVPSAGQFAQATAEAQSIALLSLMKFEFQSLHFAVKALTQCSRNLRRSLFDQRAILTMPEWPALRLIGDQKAIEESLWIYLQEAKEASENAKATRTEKRIAVLNTLRKESRQYNGYIEVGFEDSHKSAKQEAKEKRKQAKEALARILDEIMNGQLEMKGSLLSLLKELTKGENLATCPQALRNKILNALRSLDSAGCKAFADILANAFDPFITKGQELELDILILEPATKDSLNAPEAPAKQKRSLAEIIAAKKARKEA